MLNIKMVHVFHEQLKQDISIIFYIPEINWQSLL